MQTDHLDTVRHDDQLGAAVDDEPAHGIKVFAGYMEAGLDLGWQATLDLDRPQLAIGQFEQQIDLAAGRRPIEEGVSPGRCAGDQRLDGEAFPAEYQGSIPFTRSIK
jgi:hypothetical protein